MAHDHDHGDRQAYYLEQICTIALSGALAGCAIMMYLAPNGLFFLADMFKQPVLWGGAVLLALVVVRAVTLWISVGQLKPALARVNDGHDHDAGHHHHHEHGEACGHEHHDHGHGDACGHEHHHHDHGHGESCGHDHGHGAHEHAHSHGAGDDHGHSHGGNYWRFAVLLLPVVLFFMNLPNEGFDAAYLQKLAGAEIATGAAEQANFSPDVGLKLDEGDEGLPRVAFVEPDSPAGREGMMAGDYLAQVTQVADKSGKAPEKAEPVAFKDLPLDKVLDQLKGEAGSKVKVEYRRGSPSAKPVDVTLTRTEKVITLHFKELQEASSWPAKRDFYGGRRVRVKGQYSPGAAKNTFSLVRLKMTCCAADLQALKMVIESPNGVPSVQPLEWIAVEGQIEFRQRADKKNEYVTVLKVSSPEKIVPIPPEADVYMQ